MSAYYPIFLDLTQQRCLVVGGGMVAERKVHGLLEAQAQVVVVSLTLTEPLHKWADSGEILHLVRGFRAEDVEGCALVIAATNDAEANQRVAVAARQRHIWINVVDTPHACDFIAPAVLRRGSLHIAILTGGKSPLLAKRLREGLEALIGPEHCGVGCGLLVQIHNGQAMRVKGDPQHPANFGDVCAKAVMLPRALHTPDRLLYPHLRPRRDQALSRGSWSSALRTIAHAFRNIIAQHGPDAVAFYGLWVTAD